MGYSDLNVTTAVRSHEGRGCKSHAVAVVTSLLSYTYTLWPEILIKTVCQPPQSQLHNK
jgi:hypothetical protein